MVETRKLAAILAADVVGFSRMTRADEDGTLARLRALRRELIDPAVSANKGRVLSSAPATAILVEFRSVKSTRCDGSARRAEGHDCAQRQRAPSTAAIEFRIGVHMGDVVEETDGDLMGDGVNIAARLEGVAKPGGQSVSRCLEDAYRQVKGRLDLPVTDLGPTQLKNIAEPIRDLFTQRPSAHPGDARDGPRTRKIDLPRAVRSWFFPSPILGAIPGRTILSTASLRA